MPNYAILNSENEVINTVLFDGIEDIPNFIEETVVEIPEDRLSYVVIGAKYIPEENVFYSDPPFSNWVRDGWDWIPPIPKPEEIEGQPPFYWDQGDTEWKVQPPPHPSWTWNGSGWDAPIPQPEEPGKYFRWDEDTLSWVEDDNIEFYTAIENI